MMRPVAGLGRRFGIRFLSRELRGGTPAGGGGYLAKPS
jgi:hypothetical protein